MQDTLVFINKIREYQAKGLTLEELIDPVIEYCIKNNILKDFLKAHASEVVNMIFGEYNREMDIAVNRREAMEEGMEKEKLIIARNLLEKGSTPEFVQKITGLSLDKIEEIKEQLQRFGGN